METKEQSLKNRGQRLKDFIKSKNFKIFLLVLVLGLSLFGFTIQKDSKKPEEVLQVSPTPTMPYLERQQKKLQVINQLPYVEDRFSIQYFPSDDRFLIRIKKNPYNQNQNAAREWLKNAGIDPESVEIQWTSVRGVYP